ncbi:MAG: hypothetical protein R3C44_14850 [Chloroflexota bacterium]
MSWPGTPEQAADADAIARRIEVLAEEAENQNPDRALIDQIGDSVRRVANRLSPIAPAAALLGAIMEMIRFITKD